VKGANDQKDFSNGKNDAMEIFLCYRLRVFTALAPDAKYQINKAVNNKYSVCRYNLERTVVRRDRSII